MTLAVNMKCVNVYIKGKRILECINLQIPERTIYAIMGPSGSGKTTLLRVINRLIDLIPNSRVEGYVDVNGKNVFESEPSALRREIGIVFQNPNPFPHLTIYENVALGPKINRVARTRKELDELVMWALKKAMLWEEVKDKLDSPPSELSGGQEQRLCLARALAMKPKLLLLDEPTANIDPENTVKIEEALLNLRKELGVTMILVTHSPQQALRMADHIVLMNNGRIMKEGPKHLLLSEESRKTKDLLKVSESYFKPATFSEGIFKEKVWER